jgi:membrane associated rhomboid family serine protease
MPSVPAWKDIPKYPVISSVAFIAIGVTLAWWMGANISQLFETAGIRRGQLWRLITSIFPHLDILHLVFNLYWLWVLGTFVERIYGHVRTALLILLLAIGSNSFDFALAAGGVGLSGVGYGLFGLLYVLSQHDERFKDSLDTSVVNIFVLWFFFCIFMTAIHVFNVANVAHAAGAALGLLMGYVIVFPKKRVLFGMGTAALILLGLCGSTFVRPFVNLSSKGGYEEGEWGYAALVSNQNREALRWLRDAVRYQPKIASYWFNLGIAYERLNNNSASISAYKRAYELDPWNSSYAEAAGRKAEAK